MSTPAELSEAHLQDHELLSAGLSPSTTLPVDATSTSISPLTSTSLLQSQLVTALEPSTNPREAPEYRTEASQMPQEVVTPRSPSSTVPHLEHSSSLNTAPDQPKPISLLARNGTVVGPGSRKTSGPRSEDDEDRDGKKDSEVDSLAEGIDQVSVGADGGEGAAENGDSTGLDPVLLAALSHHRDRFLLLRAEVEMERFLANPSMIRLPLAPPYFQPALNSYQRLLVHRLADTFGITREVEAAPPTIWNAGAINPSTGQPQGVVVLVKGENTRLPPAKLAAYVPAPEPPAVVPPTVAIPSPSSTPSIASSPVPSIPPSASTSSLPTAPSSTTSQPATTPQILKILPRSNASRTTSSASSSIGTDDDPVSSSSAPPSVKGKNRKELTLEEREAAYKEARERIFSQPEPERATPSIAPSTSSVASEDVGSRLAGSVGAGITRPSSAGSTFSRSSAALSVAGSRPSPSIASESGSSMRSGYTGAYYGGGGGSIPPQFNPSMRPMAPNSDPNFGGVPGWTNEYGYYTGAPSWAQQQQQQAPAHPYFYPHQFSQPPIQVTGPPPHPSYPVSSFVGQGPPPPSSHEHYPSPLEPWNRPAPPPLPSPSLSTSSGSSIHHSQHHQQPSSSSAATSERSVSSSSGYLMRFADTGNIVTPGGTVTAGPHPSLFPAPSPASSIIAGPPSTTRSLSSFSSTSGLSQSSAGTGGSSGQRGNTGANGSSLGGKGSLSSRRTSGSLSSSVYTSTKSSGERKSEVNGGEGDRSRSPVESRRRERQTTIVGRSSESPTEERTQESATAPSTAHPSLPQKPTWAGAAVAKTSRAPPSSTSSTSSGANGNESSTFRPPSQPSTQNLPPPFQPQAQPHYSAQSAPYPSFPTAPPSYGQPPSFAGPPNTSSQYPNWNRPQPQLYQPPPPPPVHHYSHPPDFGHPPPLNWNYASTNPSSQRSQPSAQSNASTASPAASTVPFADIRRPPPKSTRQLFDPNKPSSGGGGGGGNNSSGMSRVASNGTSRSVSGTRDSQAES